MAIAKPRPRKQVRNPDQFPLFTPISEWTPPQSLPDLSNAEYIAIDTETFDPNLNTKGPGFIRNEAFVVGISIATELDHKLYLPIRHRDGNLDKDLVLRYCREQFSRPRQKKVFANAMYDLEALWSEGIPVKGELHDIQIAEPLLDEDRHGGYSLDSLSLTYLGYGKDKTLLKEAEEAFGTEHMKGLHELPSKYVGPYAETDADNTLQVFLLQLEEMAADDVLEIYELERKLLPVLFKMRLRGVHVDLDKAQYIADKVKIEEYDLYDGLRRECGRNFSPNSGKDISAILGDRHIHVPLTKTGAPSVTNDWLVAQGDDPFCRKLVTLRKTTKMRLDFIEGTVLEQNVSGRLHPQWNQLRDFDEDSGRSTGTRSGRISGSKPNLTQIPSRDPYWGPLIRSMFIADKGGKWVKCDYSQQEPRILLHFAYIYRNPQTKKPLEGAAEARQIYIDNPHMDYHQLVADMIQQMASMDIGRVKAKTINLGSAYGMGRDKLARGLGVSREMADLILTAYHKGVPYVKGLEHACMERVNERGFIRTILGRKRRFKLWEPSDFNLKWSTRPVSSREEAYALWGDDISRALIHKALNSLVQGSAADQIKAAIIQLDDEGLMPHVQVYDEINTTLDDMVKVRRMQEIMETVIPQFTIPFVADPDIGLSWGELNPLKWNGHSYDISKK